MKFLRFLPALLVPLLFFSCKPTQRIPNYLENVNDTIGKGAVKIPELIIQKNDLLYIKIYSDSKKPDVSDEFFNLPAAGTQGNTDANGYMVDLDGNIVIRQLGEIHAEGKTKKELASEIKKRLTEPVELLSNPSVIIRFQNFKVNVLGEVQKPGLINVPGERITILEAIGLAGDLKDFGLKKNIKVIREVNGDREIGSIDLTSKDLFESPYYNLMQNDVVLVDPAPQKSRDADQARTAQKISFAFSIITVAATLANIFIR